MKILSNQIDTAKTLSKIANKFYWYYNRQVNKFTELEAMELINYELGGACNTRPSTNYNLDFSRPRVMRSNISKPSEERIKEISENIYLWDEVFNKLTQEFENEVVLQEFILLVYKEQLSVSTVCDKMFITPSTYYSIRKKVLSKATIIAILKGAIIVLE